MTGQMRVGLVALCVAGALGIITFLVRVNDGGLNLAAVTQAGAIVAALVGLALVGAALIRVR